MLCKKKPVGREAAVPRNHSKGMSNKDQIHSASSGYLLCFVLLCLFLPESSVKTQPTWMCHSSTQPPGTSISFHKPSHPLPAYSCTVLGFLLVDIQEFLRESMVSVPLKNNYIKAALPRMFLLIHDSQENVPMVQEFMDCFHKQH